MESEFDEEAYCDECYSKGAYLVEDRYLCEFCLYWTKNGTLPSNWRITVSDGTYVVEHDQTSAVVL